MSCDARMHDVADGTKELGVVRMGEEPGRKTSILDHGLIKFMIIFLVAEGVSIRWSGFAVLLARGWTTNSEIGVFCWRGYAGFSMGFCCAQAPRRWKSKGNAFVCEGASRRDGVREPL